MLKIENLSYVYEDGTEALSKVNIDGSKGDIIGIIGANGAGKSTLFLNIMGILRANSGSITYEGRELAYGRKELRDYRKEVNIVFQNPDQQLFYSDVYDDIAFALRNLNYSEEEVKDRVTKALESVDALDLLDKPIHFLSYGQKKRVAIASILSLDSKVILMDEPTSGLDPSITEEIRNLILEISNQRKIFLSSHDMDLVYELCDYIYILNHGRVILEGSPELVFRNEELLREAKLRKPWLVKIQEKFKTPLFKNEEDFINYKFD